MLSLIVQSTQLLPTGYLFNPRPALFPTRIEIIAKIFAMQSKHSSPEKDPPQGTGQHFLDVPFEWGHYGVRLNPLKRPGIKNNCFAGPSLTLGRSGAALTGIRSRDMVRGALPGNSQHPRSLLRVLVLSLHFTTYCDQKAAERTGPTGVQSYAQAPSVCMPLAGLAL